MHSGLEYQSIGMSNEDAQFLETRKFQVEEIARFYGCPLALIGSTEKSTSWGSGIVELVLGFVKFTVSPACTQWEQALNMTLLTEREIEAGYYFQHNLAALLRGDLKTRYEAYSIGRQNGWLSANDVRGLEEMNDLPDSTGDIYLQPSNMTEAGKINQPSQVPTQ